MSEITRSRFGSGIREKTNDSNRVLPVLRALQFDRLRRIRNQIVYSRASDAAVEIAMKENSCFERMCGILIDALTETKDRS